MKLDRIYLIKYVSESKKNEKCSSEDALNKLGIDYSIWYTAGFPLKKEIVTEMGCSVKEEVDCAINHYTIIRQAYERGFKHIAVIEEDVLFNGIKTKEDFDSLLDEIPSDSDITRLCQSYPHTQKGKSKYVEQCNFTGNQFYILNRNGMKYYIDEIDNDFRPADLPMVKNDAKVKIYSLTDNTFEHNLGHKESITEKLYINNDYEGCKDRCCVVTILNDAYYEYGETLLKSFIINNKWFDGDFVFLYDDTYTVLSLENQKKLLKIYDKCVFKNVLNKDYSKIREKYNRVYEGIRFAHAVLKLELFNLYDYEKILFIDSDCVVDANISYLFKKEGISFGMAHDPLHYTNEEYLEYRNAGVIFLGDDKFKNKETFDELVSLAKSIYFKKTYFEQDLFNDYFYGKDGFETLPQKLNYTITEYEKKYSYNVKPEIIHFLTKPKIGEEINISNSKNMPATFFDIYRKYKNTKEMHTT